jgi:ubiquinone/menaquinone biosynthesis C-methylase UbiE
LSRAESLYWKARSILTPGLENSQYAYSYRLREALAAPARWLDVGCGHAVFQDWLARRIPSLDLTRHTAVGLDPDLTALKRHDAFSLRVEGSGETLPFKDRSFTLVTANMVLEHVADPTVLFHEIARVLAPGGRFLVHTPNANGYTAGLTRLVPKSLRSTVARLLHNRAEEDVYPTHYRANTTKILNALGEQAGLRVSRVEFVQTSPQLIAIPPLMVAELLIIRLLSSPSLARFRACLIAEFVKPAT